MTLQQIKDFVAATPGASWRPEELLFRLDGTGVRGAHVVVLLTLPAFAGGTPRRETHGPFPVSALADNPTLRALLGDVRLAQQAKLDAHDATLATKDARIAELKADKDRLQARLDELRPLTRDGRREQAAAKLAAQVKAEQDAAAAKAAAAADLAAIDAEPVT